MEWTVKELKDFIEDVDNDTKVVIESIVSGEERYCSDTSDIYFSEDSESDDKLLVFVPKEIEVNTSDDDEFIEVDKFADYLIENASEAFEHQDRKLLEDVIKRYFK